MLKYIFYTELLLNLRRSHTWMYPLIFFLIVISLFPLAFTPDPKFLSNYISGCIWIAALFASLLSIENIFLADLEDNHLEQIILSTAPLSFIIYIKLFTQWLITQVPLILLTPCIGIAFHLNINTILILCMSLLLGTPILILIGCLSVALTLGLRQAGMLIGLLTLPLLMPVVIFGVLITQQMQAGLNIQGPLAFLAGILVLALTLIPFAIAHVLRISLDN